MTVDVFQKKTLIEVAKELDVNPVFISWHLGLNDGLPNDMLFSNDDVEGIRKQMGLTTWWEDQTFFIEDDNPSRRLVRELAYRILQSDFNKVERFDNLVRGLQNADKKLVITTLNEMIKKRILSSESIASGLGVRFQTEAKDTLQKIADGESIPSTIERLWT